MDESDRGSTTAQSISDSRNVEHRLLIVEDDLDVARTMSRYFRASGWHVETSCDGESGAQMARSGSYSTILVDLQLPRASGHAVMKAAQEVLVPPSVIVMSGYLDVANTLSALKHGATEVLEKPIAPRRLLDILTRTELDWLNNSNQHSADGPSESEILGHSPEIVQLRQKVATVAQYTDLAVMIIGETGTGKELVARAIHQQSGSQSSMVGINCASVPEELFESELFGHEAGAFTGAKTPRMGLLEAAGNGTIFLDEVGEMPLSQQAKLLRVLETRQFRRVGSNRPIPMRARIVSATNRLLVGRTESEVMRSDLFYRLAGFTIRTPELRKHKQDLELLTRSFLATFAAGHADAPINISQTALAALASYHWPGNIRELKSVVLHSAVRSRNRVVSVRDTVEAMMEHGCIGTSPPVEAEPICVEKEIPTGLRDVEQSLIAKTFRVCDGNISRTARMLEIPRTTLRDKLKRIGLH